ncbi:AIR synthase-related protein, partial [Acinetobacter baumannii]
QHLGHSLQQRLDYPTPRCKLGEELKGLASSMIDVSDGLAQDLGHILKGSKVGARLILEKLPVDPVLQQLEEQQRWQYALAGGDDYELCFTITPQNYEKLLQKQLDVKITMIGQIVEQTKLTFEHLGSEYPLQIHGYQHFA